MAKAKIIITTGGTGGHIFPALALKQALEENGQEVIVTGDDRFAKFHPFDQDHILIPAANLSRKSLAALLISLLTLAHGFFKALWFIYQQKPDMIIGFGGYATYPMMLAAIILNKKIILHEANAYIGRVNKLLLWRAQYLTTGFKITYGINSKYKPKIIYTGNPVRQNILTIAPNRSKNKLVILIIGGSQGAKIFSKILPATMAQLSPAIKAKLFIYQQTKVEDIDQVKAYYQSHDIACEIQDFFSDMDEKLAMTNLMISRSGASTIAESIATQLPSILIPLPNSADDHQYYNAKEMATDKASWLVVEDDNIRENLLAIIKLIANDNKLLQLYTEQLTNLKQDACINIIAAIDKVI